LTGRSTSNGQLLVNLKKPFGHFFQNLCHFLQNFSHFIEILAIFYKIAAIFS